MAGRQEPFGAQLRRHREAVGYSQERLAERAGLSANAIGALERGERRRPYPDTVRRLADALGLDVEARQVLSAALHGTNPTAPDHPPQDQTPQDETAHPATTTPEALGPGAALPAEPTPLIGREQEAHALQRLLADPVRRVLTLVGPGGVGKTRLALSLARGVADRHAGGVVWVELAPLGDHTLVLAAIGRAVGLDSPGRADLASALRSWFQDRQVLLVLDNVEHVLGAVPDLAQLLLAAPGLRVLATSRSPLRLRGEQEYPVPPLELPPDEAGQDVEALSAYPAVRFFVWQAQQKDPTFALDARQLQTVTSLCRRLDGLPLAIELVASRVRTLTPAELLARVDDLMPLLVGGARDLPHRQQTMRSALAWSEDLLDAGERALFRRLSVFAGGWTLAAAEAVCADDTAVPVLDLLDSLVEQSLVTATHRADGTRYGMLEPIRQYALGQLDDAAELSASRLRHARHYLELAEQSARELEGRSGQAALLERLEQEEDNLRAALSWSEHAADGIEIALRLASALWRFWEMRWRVAEGSRWLAGALSRSDGVAPELRAEALNAAGNLARVQGDYDRAIAYHEESLALRRQLGDTCGIGRSLNNLGAVARDRGDSARTLELCQESLQLFQQIGDQHRAAIALISLGTAAAQQHDLARARSFFEESLSLFRASRDDWHIGWVLTYYAEVIVVDGELAGARSLAEESLVSHRTLGDVWGVASALCVLARCDQLEGDLPRAAVRLAEALQLLGGAGVERAVPSVLEDLAGVLAAAGRPADAARLAGAADQWRTGSRLPRQPVQLRELVATLEELRILHAAEWRAGSALGRERVLDEAATAVGRVAAGVEKTDAERAGAEKTDPETTDAEVTLDGAAPAGSGA